MATTFTLPVITTTFTKILETVSYSVTTSNSLTTIISTTTTTLLGTTTIATTNGAGVSILTNIEDISITVGALFVIFSVISGTILYSRNNLKKELEIVKAGGSGWKSNNPYR